MRLLSPNFARLRQPEHPESEFIQRCGHFLARNIDFRGPKRKKPSLSDVPRPGFTLIT